MSHCTIFTVLKKFPTVALKYGPDYSILYSMQSDILRCRLADTLFSDTTLPACMSSRLQCDDLQQRSPTAVEERIFSLAQLPGELPEQSAMCVLHHRTAQRTRPAELHRLQRQRHTVEVRYVRPHGTHLLKTT